LTGRAEREPRLVVLGASAAVSSWLSRSAFHRGGRRAAKSLRRGRASRGSTSVRYAVGLTPTKRQEPKIADAIAARSLPGSDPVSEPGEPCPEGLPGATRVWGTVVAQRAPSLELLDVLEDDDRGRTFRAQRIATLSRSGCSENRRQCRGRRPARLRAVGGHHRPSRQGRSPTCLGTAAQHEWRLPWCEWRLS
jgi:hypothetical protein